jgi:ribosome-associated toxin RatA of RatAB toxin-antitoxin module
MKKILFPLVGLFSLFPLAAYAAGEAAPAMLHATETVEINAPAAKVWDAVKDFDALPKWHPGFSKDEIVKGTNNQVGAVRQLTLKDGPSFTEELTAFSDKRRRYSYKIVESPLPLTDYHSTLRVRAVGKDKSKVVWSGSFKRKNTSPNPPEAESDEGVTKLIHGAYRAGLDNLKKIAEGS